MYSLTTTKIKNILPISQLSLLAITLQHDDLSFFEGLFPRGV